MASVYFYQDELTGFKKVTGASLEKIAVGDADNVWGLDAAGKIFRYNTGTGKFVQVAKTQTLKQIAVGAEVWGIGAKGAPHKWDGDKFVKVDGLAAYIGVPLSGGTPWTRFGQSILKYNNTKKAFTAVAGTYQALAVGDNSNDVWALDNDGCACMWNSKKFVKRDDESLRFKYIAVGNSHVYAISLSERIYRTSLLTGYVQPSFEDGLINTSGRLNYVDAGITSIFAKEGSADVETIWGMNSAGKAYELKNGWVYRGGPFSKLAVGVGTLKENLDPNGKKYMYYDEPNVWALK